MNKSLRWITMLLIAALFSLGCGLSTLLDNPTPSAAPAPSTTQNESAPSNLPTATPIAIPTAVPVAGLDSDENLLVNLYARVSPSVVFVSVLVPGSASATTGEASGSGFVIDSDGHIVTNNHVVEGTSKIRVKFSGAIDVEGKLVGRDPDTDLAVLQVKVSQNVLRPIVLGDSNNLKVGQRAIAIGNPFGFERALSVGYISAVGRVVRLQDSGYSLPELIQTDAAINPGNSGGPLLNAKGEVIGVTNLIFSRSGVNSGVGFAVPVETVKRVVPELIKSGKYAHPWLGISADRDSINSDMAEQLTLPVEHGVLIQEVIAGGPAAKAGLIGGSKRATYNGRPVQIGGDIIVAIDGKEVRSFDDVITYLAKSTKVGQQVELSIVRGSNPQKVKVTLGERPR